MGTFSILFCRSQKRVWGRRGGGAAKILLHVVWVGEGRGERLVGRNPAAFAGGRLLQ